MIHLRDLIILRRCRDAILAAQVVISEECGIDLDDDIDGLALRTAAASMNALLGLETSPGEMELLDQHAAAESAALAALLGMRMSRARLLRLHRDMRPDEPPPVTDAERAALAAITPQRPKNFE